MLTASELASMRATSRSALPDTGTITRPGHGAPAFDETTGNYTGPPPQIIYTGPCRVRPEQAVEKDVETGEMAETLGRYIGTFPHDVGELLVDDFLVLSVSADAQLVGRPLRIVHINQGSWQIDRRIVLQDREQP